MTHLDRDVVLWAGSVGALEALAARQKEALLLRYDSTGRVLRTYVEIGGCLQVTRQAAHQLVQAALRRLHRLRDLAQDAASVAARVHAERELIAWALRTGALDRLGRTQKQVLLLACDLAPASGGTYAGLARRVLVGRDQAHRVAAVLRRLRKLELRELCPSEEAYHALRRAGINSVSELALSSDTELLDRFPTLFTTSMLDQLRSAVLARGLPVKAGEELTDSLASLRLSRRTHLALRRGGFHTVQSLLGLSPGELVGRCRGFGAACLEELERSLAAKGLSLGTEPRTEGSVGRR